MRARTQDVRAVTRLAPAKVNLHLGVHAEKDARGYHRVDSVMVALDLADVVTVEPAGSLSVTCVPPAGFPEQSNTAFRAASLLAAALGRPADVRVTLEKHIPEQSGMGGSSSDAASVLLALCELWGLDPLDARVAKAARAVGADVPFFLDPRPTLLAGAGDVPREKFLPLDGVPVALVRPEGPGVSTPAAYREFDRLHDPAADPAPICSALRASDARAVAGLLENNLDPVARRLLPEVDRVRGWLSAREGVVACQVTGSGSCVFAVCESRAAAEAAAAEARLVSAGADGRPMRWSRAAVTNYSPSQIPVAKARKLC